MHSPLTQPFHRYSLLRALMRRLQQAGILCRDAQSIILQAYLLGREAATESALPSVPPQATIGSSPASKGHDR